ncbi:MAG: ThuA domain-containing protein, partial [Pirellulales bacterium]
SGKPIVGIRTASHGFQNWQEFDKTYLGGNYTGHYGNGPATTVRIVPNAKDHPLLRGVSSPLVSKYSLYKTAPLADDCLTLMTGETPEADTAQPVSWAREIKGQRIFYTALGGVEDMQMPAMRRLLLNALLWTTGREIPAE